MTWSRPHRYAPDDRAGDDHDDDALERLAARRPVDLPELGVGLADELPALLLGLASGLLLDGLLGRPDLLLRVARRELGAASPAAARAARRCLRVSRATYLVSRCGVCRPHQRQYFLNSTRSGEFRLDFCVW